VTERLPGRSRRAIFEPDDARPDAHQEVDRLSIGGAMAMLVTLPLLVYYV
jgi:hypothetical protein